MYFIYIYIIKCINTVYKANLSFKKFDYEKIIIIIMS